MSIADSIEISDPEKPLARFSVNKNMDNMNDSDSDDDSYKFNSSLEWQLKKLPYESYIFGWGNTVDGELGLGGIEEQHILFPRQITFHDSENIKYGEYFDKMSVILFNRSKVIFLRNEICLHVEYSKVIRVEVFKILFCNMRALCA